MSPSRATESDGPRPAAVIIGLDSMQGIQTARILHRRGIPVIAIAADKSHANCRTNTCERVLFADTGTEDVVRALLDLGPTLAQKAVLFPCQDKSVRMVSLHRDRLAAHFHVVLPPSGVVEMLMDKAAFYAYAREHGLPVPETRYLHGREDAQRAARELQFPCLLKPSRRSDNWDRHTSAKVFKVDSPEALMARYDECRGWVDVMVAQSWVEGDDSNLVSCNGYFGADSKPLATFVARKLRQWPPDTGSSCLGEEVRNDTVLEATIALFEAVGYRGLGYLEMKRDARTGKHFIIEPNIGRPTGRSAIAEAGGVELLHTMYCDALGLPLPTERTQQFGGAKWIDLRHDLQSAFVSWRRGDLSIADWVRSCRGRKAHTVFSWRDPQPFLFDLKDAIARSLFGRARTRAKR